MRTFIQLKDSVGWAFVNTASEIQGAIEVDSGTGDFYLKKKYENGIWKEAELIKFAEINENGEIIEIKHTYFSSEINGPIMDFNTKSNSKWINGAWVHYDSISLAEQSVMNSPQLNNEEYNVQQEKN